MKQAKILFHTLLKGKLDSSPNYETYEQSFLPTISAVGGVSKVLESFKCDIMQGDSNACYILAKIYEIGFYNQPKDNGMTNLLTLIGHKLGNIECTKIIQSNPAQYSIFENFADKFIASYAGKNQYIYFEDAVLNSTLPSYEESLILGLGGQAAELYSQ
ncbi:MAG TPA: hypothetical protein LFW21_06360 [Rickettsia endosymbiont of Pyrocoelia pectoralis]|nr:hypothetical protein [Rickettsia endosymbiont of Pyrocoelia pectoralis]